MPQLSKGRAGPRRPVKVYGVFKISPISERYVNKKKPNMEDPRGERKTILLDWGLPHG
jgi:hypothetical protein